MTSPFIIAWVAALLAITAALRAAIRRGHTIASVSYAAGMLLTAAEVIFVSLGYVGSDPVLSASAVTWRLVIAALSAPVWIIFSLTYSRVAPRQFIRKWAFALGGISAGALAIILWLNLDYPPVVAEGGVRLSFAGCAVLVFRLVCATVVLMNLEHTFRSAVGVARWQLKFLVIGLGVMFLARVYTGTQFLLYRAITDPLDIVNCFALAIASIMAHIAFGRGQPFSLALTLPETAPYRSAVVVLIGAYLFTIGVVANVARMFGWVGTFPMVAFLVLLAVAIAGLVLVSDRVRVKSRRFLSRFLGRSMHDFRQIWTDYNERTIGQSDDVELSRSTVKLIAETFDMLSVTSWHIGPAGVLSFGASTALSNAEAARLLENHAQLGVALNAIREHRLPIDIDSARESWATPLRDLHPVRFKTGGKRFCVPVRAGEELVAVIMAGDRAGDLRMSMEELDLLACIADQLGRDLARIRLSQRLAEGKEMQAFQTVATFFIHDLKNTAYTLSLLLDNLRVHFDRPEFRDDAVRTLSKSVGRINEIVNRLGGLRHEFKLNRVPSDLNAVIGTVLKEVEPLKDATITRQLGALDPVELDPEQMEKVILNLVLNAREALNGPGRIEIETEQQNGSALLRVRDNGAGMSPEFLRTRLFRPFQTTKPKGIGIGMFQVKMIVEGHGGAISVESHVGQGTTFSISLPVGRGSR